LLLAWAANGDEAIKRHGRAEQGRKELPEIVQHRVHLAERGAKRPVTKYHIENTNF